MRDLIFPAITCIEIFFIQGNVQNILIHIRQFIDSFNLLVIFVSVWFTFDKVMNSLS